MLPFKDALGEKAMEPPSSLFRLLGSLPTAEPKSDDCAVESGPCPELDGAR